MKDNSKNEQKYSEYSFQESRIADKVIANYENILGNVSGVSKALNGKTSAISELASTAKLATGIFDQQTVAMAQTAQAIGLRTSQIAEFTVNDSKLFELASTANEFMSKYHDNWESISSITKALGVRTSAISELASTAKLATGIFDQQTVAMAQTAQAIGLCTSQIAEFTVNDSKLFEFASTANEFMSKYHDSWESISSITKALGVRTSAISELASTAKLATGIFNLQAESMVQTAEAVGLRTTQISELTTNNNKLFELASTASEFMSQYNKHWENISGVTEPQESYDTNNISSSTESESSLSKSNPQLNLTYVVVILYLLHEIILPMLVSISSNILTPHIQDQINQGHKVRQQINNIKKIPQLSADSTLTNLRFINATRVNLRTSPSIKSDSIDMLTLGQVVTVIAKERNWTEVSYIHSSGDVFKGWVFTRYTSRFKYN